MVNVDKAIIASIDKEGKHFEILVDADVALNIREGADFNANYNKLLASDEVFKDSKKGDRSSTSNLNNIFGTDDVKEIAKIIVLEGRVELTTEQKRKKTEQKRKALILYISKNAINPLTKTPHPPQRVELAMDKAKIMVDPTKSIKAQVDKIIEKLRPIIPLSFEKEEIIISIPIGYASKSLGLLNKYDILEKKWNNSELKLKLNINSAQKKEIMDKIYNLTSGKAEFGKEW